MEHWNDALPFAPVAADECLAAAVAAYDRRYREFLREFEPQRGPKHFTEEGQRELLRRSAFAGRAFSTACRVCRLFLNCSKKNPLFVMFFSYLWVILSFVNQIEPPNKVI